MRKTIHIQGINFSYLEYNETGKQVIFFIHGNSGSTRSWDNQLDSSLFREYRLIAIDLPGHGESYVSETGEWFSPAGTAKLLAKAIQALTGEQPYYCVGFSYGSNLIAEMIPLGIEPRGIAFAGPCVTGPGYGLDIIFPPHETPPIFFL